MIERALAALDSGDLAPLRALVASAAELNELELQQAWHAVSTLAGRVVGRLVIVQADARHDGVLADRPAIVAGGAPRTVAEAAALGFELAAALDPAPTAETHRRAALATLAALRDGSLPAWSRDPAAALLRHHADLAVDMPPRPPLVDAQAEAAALEPLLAALRDPAAFDAHLNAGLTSPSAARRRLARRLLALPASSRGERTPRAAKRRRA